MREIYLAGGCFWGTEAYFTEIAGVIATSVGYCHIGRASIAAAKDATPTPDLRETLTPLQYEVTQNAATEPPYQNEYWDFYADGIYLDITTGKPLFASVDKFPCHAGWAAFAKPIAEHIITEHEDNTLGRQRTEVKSKHGNAHLGHVFKDGPAELGGLRYCINSAALEFVPKDELKAAGLSEYLKIFE